MKRLYTLIIALTLNSIGRIVGHIVDYLDIKFIEEQSYYKPDEFIHSYTGILSSIKFYSGVIRVLCAILIVIFIMINVINLIKKYRKNDLVAMEKYAKNIKIGLIPFWIFQLCLIIGSIYTSLNIYNGSSFFINAFFESNFYYYLFSSYFFLLLSSIFSIGYIKLLFKNNKIDKKMFNKQKAMQLFFVFDVISIIHLLKKEGTKVEK